MLVTEITDPHWEPIMKLASAIVTERGGRTSHAAIVAGELGIAAVVGTADATEAIQSGNPVTVSCCEGEVGHVYDGTLDYDVTQIDSATLGRPESRTMINVANPERDEIPSNAILAKEFAEIFDGFSIGSNDLTQLILGVDRDSERVAPLFEERDQAVKELCAVLIEEAHRAARKVGICGQAPSDYPEFAAFLGLKTIVARQMGQIDQVAIPSSRYA